MIENLAKHKYILYITWIGMLWDVASGFLLQRLFPTHYLRLYPLIPFYFYILNVGSYLLVDSFKAKSTSSVMLFLGSKMLKMILSVIVLLIFLVFSKTQVVEFLVAFLGNYLFFLILDSVLMLKFKPHKAAFDDAVEKK